MSLQGIGWLFFDLGNTLIDESKPEEVRIKSIQGIGIEKPDPEIFLWHWRMRNVNRKMQ
jgi:FMN phosphatase YigB (HAD superfamily)